MKRSIALVLLIACCLSVFAQPAYQLAPPLLKVPSVFFGKKAVVGLEFRMEGAQIRYTLNGKEPLATDRLYTQPVVVTKSLTTIKARSVKQGFLPSETVSATFIRDGLTIDSCIFSQPNARFPGTGANTLIDNNGGLASINSKGWLGYKDDSVDVVLKLKKTEKVSKVLLDMLQDHGSWVFLPQQIDVFYKDPKTGEQKNFGSMSIAADRVIAGASAEYRIVRAPRPVRTKDITIRLHVLRSMPEAHPGKGTSSWIFIDEIKVY